MVAKNVGCVVIAIKNLLTKTSLKFNLVLYYLYYIIYIYIYIS